jgi:hypothetical protein
MPELWFRSPTTHKPSHDRIAITQEGKLIAMGKNYVVTTFSEQRACVELNVRVPDLRYIEYVLNVQLEADPLDCAYPQYEAVNKKITGNVVGMTIYGAAYSTGVTVIAEVIAIGPP